MPITRDDDIDTLRTILERLSRIPMLGWLLGPASDERYIYISYDRKKPSIVVVNLRSRFRIRCIQTPSLCNTPTAGPSCGKTANVSH